MSDFDDLRNSGFDDEEDDDFGGGGEAVIAPQREGFSPVERLILMVFGFLNVVALVVIILIAFGRIG